MVQLFVKNLDSRSVAYEVEETCLVSHLKDLVQAKEGVPSSSQGLVYAGRQLADDAAVFDYGVSSGSTVHLVLRLRGGKGGFGALLRGQGRDGKITTNFDACRDLQGRRIRHSKSESVLAEWQDGAKDRELEKIAMKHIKDLAKQQRKDAREQVDVDDVMAKQKQAMQNVQDAVQSALASAGAASAMAAGAKRKAGKDAGKDGAGAEAKAEEAAAKKPAPKKAKMLACLDEISDSDEDSEGSDA